MRRSVIVVLALALSAMLVLGLAGCDGSGTEAEEKAPLHFIQFFDPDCPFCQAMEPTVDSLREEYEPQIQEFEIVDVSTPEGLAKADEFGVFITPTFVLLDGEGNELDRVAGAATEENMVTFIERGIADVTGESAGPREEIPTTGGTEAE
ncbi:thioredoxin family protein [Anaerosoma tenue]|uniref:thioredoxin family protein n=1 Tax=Anaerosoma tenue TaxID=2933588 RepID=UPI002260AE4D|nr:thioredoxin family protein [Anaerosoma tenue]MCK8114749.1 thioredoxin family protein [Anaerosoma tenue]